VRLFDGVDVVPAATVIVRCSRIDRVIEAGEVAVAPAGSKLIDGKGKFLLPGLIDSHVHTFRRGMLERSLDFGVTTVFDMGSPTLEFKSAIDAEDARTQADDRADMYGAVLWVTAPGSHGTQFGEVPTLDNPDNAAEFVAGRIEDGADFIKIIYDNFKMFDRPVPTLSNETMQEVVSEAHRLGVMAVVHSRDVDAYADVVEAGADGIVHLPVDEVPEQELVSAMKSTEVFVIPNLSLARPEGARLFDDPVIGPMLTEQEVTNLRNFRANHREGGDQIVYESVKAFHEGGVTILSGSDSPNGGTTVGASMHAELELLVDAGLTPIEAMAAATSTPARVFGLDDRGCIAEGLLADLLLVAGSPDQSIDDTKNIITVWKAGKAHSRATSVE
jgi:imidazolonepropionase-like amidohydrolase